MPPPPSLPDRLSLAAQLLTVLLLGLMAGFFATYSANVNLATLELNGPTYAQVQSAFNRNVRHAGFFACFFGPPTAGPAGACCGLASQEAGVVAVTGTDGAYLRAGHRAVYPAGQPAAEPPD